MATLYKSDGTQQTVIPKNLKKFTKKELSKLVGGFPKFLYSNNDEVIIVNDDAAREELPLNVVATQIINKLGYQPPLVGDVVIASPKHVQ